MLGQIPTDAAQTLVDVVTDTATDAWPVLVAMLGVGIGLKIFRRFSR